MSDPFATLTPGYPVTSGYDPNATYVAQHNDPHATLVGSLDDNATLVGTPGDNEATLVGDGQFHGQFVNNSARLAALQNAQPTILPHIRMVPHNPFFAMVDRDVPRTIKFGRLTDPPVDEPDFVGFASKVVSRRHAEIWTVNSEFYIRDTKSQSGTFLNAMRLSLPGEESKPFKLKNGDSVQFGVDRRGETADDMKCVAMSIELSFRKNNPPATAPRPAPPSPQQLTGSPKPASISDLTLVAQQHQQHQQRK